jgi:hypothetical protein
VVPPPEPAACGAIVDRLAAEAAVEHAELVSVDGTAALFRLSLRTPLDWPRMRPLLERGLDAPLTPGSVRWEAGSIQIIRDGGGGSDRPASAPAGTDAAVG